MVIIVQRHGEEDAETRNCEEEASKESRGTDALREYHGSSKGVVFEKENHEPRKPKKPCIAGFQGGSILFFWGYLRGVSVCASVRPTSYRG